MDERSAWYKRLEENPEDGGLRMIFADWLDDRGERELAAGFRALGQLRRRPVTFDDGRTWGYVPLGLPRQDGEKEECRQLVSSGGWFLSPDWCRETKGKYDERNEKKRHYPTSTAAEIGAALAWSRLTPEQQAEAVELLGVPECV